MLQKDFGVEQEQELRAVVTNFYLNHDNIIFLLINSLFKNLYYWFSKLEYKNEAEGRAEKWPPS